MRHIQLTRGKVAIVDDADYELLARHKWHCTCDGYAGRSVLRGMRWTKVWMHREILCPADGLTCDHINGNRLDNRRCNLRLATNEENQCNKKMGANNTSGFKGVCYHKSTRKWQAQISSGSGYKYLGLFTTREEAADAYDSAARELHGEFARTNQAAQR